MQFTIEELQEQLENYSYAAEHELSRNADGDVEYNLVVITAGDVTLEMVLEDSSAGSSVDIADMVEVNRYAPRKAVEDVGARFDTVDNLDELMEAVLETAKA